MIKKSIWGLIVLGLLACEGVPETGWISVISEPEGAEVYLNDSLTGKQTNCVIGEIDTGVHVVYIELDSFTFGVDTVTVTAGDTVSVDFSLNRIGTVFWTYYVEGAYNVNRGTACPAISSDGTIYWGVTDGNLYALSSDGALLWKYHTGHEIYTAPVIGYDGTIFFNCYITLYALNADGSLKWSATSGSLNYSPAISQDGTVYTIWEGTNRRLIAFDQNGNSKWAYQLDNVPSSNPSISTNGTIYVITSMPSISSELWAINSDSSLKWRYDLNAVATEGASIAIDVDGTIFVDGYLFLNAINPNGTQKWLSPGNGMHPVIAPNGTIYVGGFAVTPQGEAEQILEDVYRCTQTVGADGTIYLIDEDMLYALDPDGNIRWQYGLLGEYPSAPTISPDGILYIGTADGYLHAIYTDSRGLADSPWPKYQCDLQNTGCAK